MKKLTLHPGRERRVLQGHRWIFSNEIAGPFSEYEPGSWVKVYSSKGTPLGSGYINPAALIAVRLLCPPGQEPGAEFFRQTIERAAALRERLYPDSLCYRLIFGESDGLPGLVVDRYADALVYQVTTVGMARMEKLMQELLIDLFSPTALVTRNDSFSRTYEGLEMEKGVVYGSLPARQEVDLDGIRFEVDLLGGQKTGLYLDQRENRRALRRMAQGKRVLDLFCYNGAWSLSAMAGGAAETIGVDGSEAAVARARANAVLNGAGDISSFVAADVFEYLKKAEKASFDIVISDPPAFARTRSAVAEARKGYTDLNRRAMAALKRGGLLVTCSCSYHMTGELFRESLLAAARAAGRTLRLLESRGQAPDHPVLLAMPETQYLKCLFLEVS